MLEPDSMMGLQLTRSIGTDSLMCYQGCWRFCHIFVPKVGYPWIPNMDIQYGYPRAPDMAIKILQTCQILYDYLISMSVTANNNRFQPSWYKSWNVLTDYCLPEHSSTKNVTNCTIGRFPHFLQIKLWQCDIKKLSVVLLKSSLKMRLQNPQHDCQKTR